MNVFGAFTFGSLIKTFLPGLVWLAALWLLWRDAQFLLPSLPVPRTFADTEQNGLVLAIPLALLCGLLSNIIVFMGINDWLVRNPVRRASPDLTNLYAALSLRLRENCRAAIPGAALAPDDTFLLHTDPEIVLLSAIGPQTLAYVREQYWYHLEFQVNLLLALAALALGVLAAPAKLRGVVTEPVPTLIRTAVELAVLAGLSALLVVAARRNYHRHLQKMCSLMAATLSETASPPANPPPRSPGLFARLRKAL